MKPKGNLSSRKKGEVEYREQTIRGMVKTLLENFMRSDVNYGTITETKADVKDVYKVLMDYVNREKLDVYMLKLEDRILLSKTNVRFEELYETVRKKSKLETKKDITEIWNDADNQILHLFVIPIRKHFPIEYSNTTHKTDLVNKILSTT
jgi:hypothetical protein